MKIWYPISFEQSKNNNINLYNAMCLFDLYRFKNILKNNLSLVNTKLPGIQIRLNECPLVKVNNEITFNINAILNRYINSLTCKCDNSSRCYYYVPDIVRCPGAENSLNFVIRLIEYGNDTIPPLNWIRHSYTLFEEYIGDKNEC